jgi:hypothetical protein
LIQSIKVFLRAYRRAISAQASLRSPPAKVRRAATVDGEPQYDELVEVLACHVHEHWLRPDRSGTWTFDHMHSSGQQIPAAILQKLKILKRVGDGKHSTPLVFACDPEEFKVRALENRELGCSYETVVLGLLAIMDYGKPEDELYACLARLGICELKDDGYVEWTEKYNYYMKTLYRDWTKLIA